MSEKNQDSGATQSMFAGDISFMDCPRINRNFKLPENSIVALGIPFDTSTSNRPGTRLGPRGVRTASKMISWQRVYDWKEDIFHGEGRRVFDLGDVDFDYGRKESIFDGIDQAIKFVLDHHSKPLTIGGDHFITYPILKSIFKHRQKAGNSEKIALVHFDAHSDTWKDEPGRIDHGTGFYHAIQEDIIDPKHSIQIGIRTFNEDDCGIETIDAFAAMKLSAEEIVDKIRKRVGNRDVYLTIDIDVLDAAFAPGTGTPTVGGLSTIHLLSILKKCSKLKLPLIGADLVEVSPPYDHAEITSLAGATIAAYQGHLLARTN